jgi:hypothetical protein
LYQWTDEANLKLMRAIRIGGKSREFFWRKLVMKKVFIICAVVIFALAVPAGAVTINYTVSGWGPNQYPASITPPANAPWGVNGYPGDTLELVTYTGTLDLTPGTYNLKINTLKWTIDYTYGGTETDPNDWSIVLQNITAIRSISFDGGPSGSLSQTALLENQWDNDFLTIYEGATSSFTVGGFQVDVTPLGLNQFGGTNFSGDNPWVQPEQDIIARFDVVPEPPSVALVPNALHVAPGSTVTVSVNMTVTDPITMAAISTRILYDPNVFTYDANSGVVKGGLLTHIWDLSAGSPAEGELRVGGIDLGLYYPDYFETLAAGSGKLFTFSLKAKEDAPTGPSALTWGVYDGYDNATAGFDYGDKDGLDVILPSEAMSGASINVCPAGDLDGDCDVDFKDLAILANNWLVGTEG